MKRFLKLLAISIIVLIIIIIVGSNFYVKPTKPVLTEGQKQMEKIEQGIAIMNKGQLTWVCSRATRSTLRNFETEASYLDKTLVKSKGDSFKYTIIGYADSILTRRQKVKIVCHFNKLKNELVGSAQMVRFEYGVIMN